MFSRVDVRFSSAGQQCSAWLYLPEGNRPGPVIVMAHGLGGVREMRLDAFAERFCAAGYVCLVFDYRHFGASEGQPRQILAIDRQLEDWGSAINHARTLEAVDAEQIILWGTSFSGGHVLVAAANEKNVSAVVSQCPFTDGMASALAANLRSSLKVMALAICDVVGAVFGLAPVMVAIAGKPGSAALMATPDAEAGCMALVSNGAPAFRNYVAARFALGVICYRPGLHTRQIRCPVLFCVCETDSVAPSGATLRHAHKAPHGEVKLYRQGHFDIYAGEAFEQVVADQIAFLKRCVPSSSRAL